MAITKQAEVVPQVVPTKVYKCESCDAMSEEVGPALYECNECGTIFNRNNSANDNHQCPQCNKFASKIADESCAECNEGEVTEEWAIQCSCHDDWHIV